MNITKFTKTVLLSSSLLVLASCGSSSGSGGPTPPGGNHIFGVFKGATDGASCSVTDANGTYAVPTKTADTGLTTVVSTTMSLAQGVVVLECSSGQYVDEATNNTLPGITMRASTNYPGSGPLILVASPLSEIAYRRAAERGLDANGLPSATNVGAMNTDVADEFGLTKVGGNLATTIPPNIMDGSSTPDNDAAGQLAVALAAVSQMVEDEAGGAKSVSDLIDGIQQDMENGGMDTTTYSVEAALGSLTGTASSAIANGTVDTSTIVADAGDTDGGDGSATAVIDITGATLSYTPTADVVGTVGVAITEISPVLSTGFASVYSIDSLPGGLTISATTGVISGTPTATQAATVYTITAENTAGSTTGTISITVNAAAANNPVSGVPTISGTAQEGQTLTADTSGLSDTDGMVGASFAYQWKADGTDISGATNKTYVLTSAEVGKKITVMVSFTDDKSNAESATSAETAVVSAAANNPVSGVPTISGTAQEDQTLTADTSGLSDTDGMSGASFAYQWKADGTDISGATNNTYVLTSAEVGKKITVMVSFTDDKGNAESATSAETAAVSAAAPTITSIDVKTGLTVNNDTPTGAITMGAMNIGSAASDGVSTNTMVITGTNFEASQGSGKVEIGNPQGGTFTATIVSWDDTSIEFYVPAATSSSSGAQDDVNIVVTNNSGASSSGDTFRYEDCDVCRIVNGCPF
jgi:hypothetical protein